MSPIYVPGKVTLAKDYVPVDPDFNNVSLLLHGDGTNGSTTILDSSPSPKTVTAVGDAQISTAQNKFGGASIAFDGSGDYLTIPSTAAFEFGANDYTIEFWLKKTLNSLGGFVDLGMNYGGVGIYQNGNFYVRIASSDVFTLPQPQNEWVHIALSRSGSSLRIFFNGVQQGATVTNSTNLINSFGTVAVGAFIFVGTYYPTPQAYIDDLRITKGVARYTANFTPPTAAFPDIESR